ncbi:MAG: hypothetical protein DYH06_12055, partial [Acidobacteria bacterium ACB2]|nr:hypothetical protein [Acidobacteria bacterium ACB2]
FDPATVVVPPCPGTPTPPVPTPTRVAPTPTPTPVAVAPTGNRRTWTYTLKFDLPSRIAVMKNALGDSVSVIQSYTPPITDASDRTKFAAGTPWRDAGNTVTVAPVLDQNDYTNPFSGTLMTVTEINPACNPPGSIAGCTTWQYTLDYGAGNAGVAPGEPFDPFYDNDGAVAASNRANGTPGHDSSGNKIGVWTVDAPLNIIGQNASRVNWGLTVYSGLGNPDECSYTTTTHASLVVPIDTSDAGDVTGILSYLRLGKDGGLLVGGGTPTKVALDVAQKALVDTFAGDPKYACLRTYGVILVTDGESNICNPGHNTWADCTTDYFASFVDYPPQVAQDIWALNLEKPCTDKPPRGPLEGPITPRTWVIGFGPEVSRCELNYTAYRGRTDAASPNADAGFDTGADIDPDSNQPRLPDLTWPSVDPDNFQPGAGKDYAFFADSSAGLSESFEKIVSSTAQGDYATNAPVSGGAAGAGNIVFVGSSEFPEWRGHLYAYDITKLPSDPDYLKWDAGARLDLLPDSKRKVYTWDPASGNALVEVTEANLVALRAISSRLNGHANPERVVRFIRGLQDDGLTPRTGRLGPLVNSTPALVATPYIYRQGRLIYNHDDFARTYISRTSVERTGRLSVVWVGGDDGLLHAFNFHTGDEIVALLPPTLLDRQVDLYANYKSGTVNGQLPSLAFSAHLWGVANSVRHGDVYKTTGSSPGWITMALVTLGAGGDEVFALDVTHPYGGDSTALPPLPADPEYGKFDGVTGTDPVKVLWHQKGQSAGGSLAGYFKSWSIPAQAPTSSTNWKAQFGNGADPASTLASPVAPRIFEIDPVTGTTSSALLDVYTGPNGPNLVGNQAFADAVLFETARDGYASDNIANLGLQADLNGRIWFIPPGNLAGRIVGVDVNAKAGEAQPIYYPPSASGFGKAGGCVVLAFESGSFYEMSPKVTGKNVGQTGYFTPSLYVAAAPKSQFTTINSSSALSSSDVVQLAVNTITTPDGSALLAPTTQVTASPFMLVDPTGGQPTTALFLLYDPTKGCNGNSYVAAIDFSATSCQPVVTNTRTYDAGTGAGSGFTIAGDKVVVTKSGIGKDATAGLYQPPDIQSAIGSGIFVRPVWWQELK